jgi:hypothetical protein
MRTTLCLQPQVVDECLKRYPGKPSQVVKQVKQLEAQLAGMCRPGTTLEDPARSGSGSGGSSGAPARKKTKTSKGSSSSGSDQVAASSPEHLRRQLMALKVRWC